MVVDVNRIGLQDSIEIPPRLSDAMTWNTMSKGWHADSCTGLCYGEGLVKYVQVGWDGCGIRDTVGALLRFRARPLSFFSIVRYSHDNQSRKNIKRRPTTFEERGKQILTDGQKRVTKGEGVLCSWPPSHTEVVKRETINNGLDTKTKGKNLGGHWH